MAYRRYNLIVILTILTAMLVSCNPDAASGTSKTSNTTDYQNSVSVTLDGENLYPSAYDESDYTSWKDYDFGTEYEFDVETMTWTGTSPVDAGVASITLKTKSLKITNLTDNPINIRLTGSNDIVPDRSAFIMQPAGEDGKQRGRCARSSRR